MLTPAFFDLPLIRFAINIAQGRGRTQYPEQRQNHFCFLNLHVAMVYLKAFPIYAWVHYSQYTGGGGG